MTQEKQKEDNEEVKFYNPFLVKLAGIQVPTGFDRMLYPVWYLSEIQMCHKLILFYFQVLHAQEKNETTRVEPKSQEAQRMIATLKGKMVHKSLPTLQQ